MTLEQIAQEAMDYLDSVGVAADWEIVNDILRITTDNHVFLHGPRTKLDYTKDRLARYYPTSKDQQEIKSRIDKVKSPN